MISLLVALPRRQLYLGIIALLLAVILIARWIGNWGLVSIHAKDQPLAKVIASIARQGGVRIESSLDPSSPVTINVVKVTPVEALDKLTMVTESGWRVVYLAAPTKSAINEALLSLNGTGKIENWTTNYYPGQGGFWGADYGHVIDPRFLSITWEGPDPDLGTLLDEAAQTSGVMTALPKDWRPAVATLPKSGTLGKVIPSLIKSEHGKVAAFLYLAERPRRLGDEQNQQAESSRGWERMNPEWWEQRQRTQIGLLPAPEQEEAKKKMAERNTLFAEMQGLTREQRRAKWQQMMSNPDTLLQMQDQLLLRQTKRTPEQQISRAVDYVHRKAAAQAAQGH